MRQEVLVHARGVSRQTLTRTRPEVRPPDKEGEVERQGGRDRQQRRLWERNRKGRKENKGREEKKKREERDCEQVVGAGLLLQSLQEPSPQP